MAIEIVKLHTETLPALRLIGKRCLCHPKDFVAKWGEWFENDWFELLKQLGVAPENGEAYLGATQGDCYWIGMLFPPGTPAPDGFEYADIPASRYAVFALEGKRAGELFGEEGITLCLEEMRKQGLDTYEGGWGLEFYASPRYPTPDKKGNVLFAFRISIK